MNEHSFNVALKHFHMLVKEKINRENYFSMRCVIDKYQEMIDKKGKAVK